MSTESTPPPAATEPTPLIGPDSYFRRQPTDLDHRTALLLDGIRYSIEIADLSYRRLLQELEALSSEGILSGRPSFASEFGNAWTFVDALARLRRLVTAFPSATDSLAVATFCAGTDHLRLMRNRVQHMDERLDELVAPQWPVWGHLTWLLIREATPAGQVQKGESCMIVPGVAQWNGLLIDSPGNLINTAPISRICLHYHDLTACLDDLRGQLVDIVAVFEAALARAFGEEYFSGSDSLAFVAWESATYQRKAGKLVDEGSALQLPDPDMDQLRLSLGQQSQGPHAQRIKVNGPRSPEST